MKELVGVEIASLMSEIQEAFLDIPFENSAFQNVHFVMHQQLTPERAYRAIGLKIFGKIRALQEAHFSRKLEEIDIAELEEKRNNPAISQFDRKRAQVEIDRKLACRGFTDKLIRDAVVEVKTLFAEFKKFPKYTREQFELGEKIHFELKLRGELQGLSGAGEALLAMEHDALRNNEPLPNLI